MKYVKLVLVFFLCGLTYAEAAACKLCHMEVKEGSVTRFEVLYDGKTSSICSFSCASRMKRKYSNAVVSAIDFSTHKSIPADTAFYLVKSKKLASEMEITMPPAIAVFKEKATALLLQKKLGDGKVVEGFSTAVAVYE